MWGSASSSSYEPKVRGMPSCFASACAFARSREAIAVTSQYLPCCIAGITLVAAILAVLRMPQRILLIENDAFLTWKMRFSSEQPLTYRFLIGTLYDLAGIYAILKTH